MHPFRIYLTIINFVAHGKKENLFLPTNQIKIMDVEVAIKIIIVEKIIILKCMVFLNITSAPTSPTKYSTSFTTRMVLK